MDTENTRLDQDLGEALRSTAMLADLSFTTWTGSIRDDHAVEVLKHEAGATGDVGKFYKALLAGADSRLKEIGRHVGQARKAHYNLTMPWTKGGGEAGRGPRLLPNAMFQRYVQELAPYQTGFWERVEEFLAHYEEDRDRALKSLAGLGRASQYPSREQVRRCFSCSLDFYPLPAGGDFAGLPPATLERLGTILDERNQERLNQAIGHAFELARSRVEHVLERLATEETRFHDSMIEHLKELPGLLAGFNITGDPKLAELADDLARQVRNLDPQAVRKNPSVRQQVKSDAAAIKAKLDAWGL